jgi:plastocyanin
MTPTRLATIAFVGLMSLPGPGREADPAVSPGAGTLLGRVVYEGELPPAITVPESGAVQQVLYVGPNRALRYAVVSVEDAAPDPASAPAGATINQSGYIFIPQVTAVRDGTTLTFTNADVANHNVRAGEPPNVFSLKTSRAPVSARVRATRDGSPIVLSCDIHAWMTAWVYVFQHPQYAVTGADGRFRIDNVAAGSHDLVIRQPAGGLRRSARVSVTAGKTVAISDVVFTTADLHLPVN